MPFNFTDDDLVKSDLFTFADAGESVEGVLVGVEEGQFGDQFVIKKEDGKTIHLGSYKALNGKLTLADVGMAVKVTYKGDVKSDKGRFYKDFDIYKKKI